MARVRREAASGAVSRAALVELQGAWSNEGYAADIDYLEEVARCAAATPGPVLECGSGLTTLALGLIAGSRGVRVWSLEHEPAWLARVRSMARSGAPVEACETPLVSCGDFDWYDVSRLPLPADFRLVVCDGPPGTTRGGRYGLLPRMRERFAPGALVLLDDADRPGEREVIDRWRAEGLALVEVRRAASRPFAVLRYPGETRS